jgi:hypothetical protein
MKIVYDQNEIQDLIEKAIGKHVKGVKFKVFRSDGARLNRDDITVECEIDIDVEKMLEKHYK